ncbi:sporulation inhibitor of replication protein SirA [Peribacillus kribbensis]|uniref:sporulation inhibitor of replication protein SirA n=1 Tax=Peribacillus kribbensis TaxID=356658 RepID=UPI0006879132|nr:sporulation inhibitor of replication protein SirA [Peribacillus kribbensis]
MRIYDLYLIEDDVARHYFGRERMLYNLFLDYSQSSGELREILQKQIQFITKPFNLLRLQRVLDQHIRNHKEFSGGKRVYSIEKNDGQSSAILAANDHEIKIESRGTLEAETEFFECLRKMESSFLALDLSNRRYGWLKPIKERKFRLKEGNYYSDIV